MSNEEELTTEDAEGIKGKEERVKKPKRNAQLNPINTLLKQGAWRNQADAKAVSTASLRKTVETVSWLLDLLALAFEARC